MEVEVLKVSGSIAEVCEIGRISYRKNAEKKDIDFFKFLLKNGHTAPLEMMNFTFKLKLPIFLARRVLKFRTARVNEAICDFEEIPDNFYLPSVDFIGMQETKDGKGGFGLLELEAADKIKKVIYESSHNAYCEYRTLLSMGVSKHTASMVLSNNFYTTMIWQCDLNNMLKFLRKGLKAKTPKEMTEICHLMLKKCKELNEIFNIYNN